VRLEWSDGSGDHRLAASDLSVRLTSLAGERELRALVDDATEHCPVCQAIRGNVAMQVTASFDAT
jgi:organic hydroperoxide reductase OsmC/OhrA